jgi:hypothetical protein
MMHEHNKDPRQLLIAKPASCSNLLVEILRVVM